MKAWLLLAIAFLAAPWAFPGNFALTLLTQMGTFIIFALSYNMLLGHGGMLSFGHAVYSGLGAYVAVHALNTMAKAGGFALPLPLLPLVGGLAGLAFGVLFGYVTTKRAGTTFAMISLGIGELVYACVLMLPDFFGGEAGVSTNRTALGPFLGLTFGPAMQVYYLVAAWCLASMVAMHALTRTPLGRMANAVRDNPERAEFVGYDTQKVRFLQLVLSAFFAGVSGALSCINFEIVSAENVSAIRSGSILLFTFIGGIGFFFGPLLGAIVGILFSVLLSDFTPAWQLYLGLFFVLLVRYAPGGLGSLIMLLLRAAKFGQFGRIAGPLGWVCLAVLPGLAGFIAGVEMLYHLTLEAANGSVKQLFGMAVDTRTALPWAVVGGLLTASILAWRKAQPVFAEAWDESCAAIALQTRSAR